MSAHPTRRVSVTHAGRGSVEARDDTVVTEEPLEIRVSGEPIATTMRTPGHDRELVLGFLWSEGIISSPDDVSGLAHCGRTGDEGRANTIEVTLACGVRLPAAFVEGGLARRGTIVSAACGVCGRRSIDDLVERFTPVPVGKTISRDTIAGAVATLRDRQPVFAATGGCHAASLVASTGQHVATFEDVGRHNAVDKLVGSQVRARTMPLADRVLVVSGRASFEIVQKAVAARIPVVASISAASSLAIDAAARGEIALVGFVRGTSMTIYTGAERLAE